MSGMLPVMAGLTIVFLGLSLLVLRLIRREARLSARLLVVQRSIGVDQVTVPWSLQRAVLGLVTRVGGLLTRQGVLSARTVQDLEQTLSAAGFRGEGVLPLFIGAKIAMLVMLPALGFLFTVAVGLGGPFQTLLVAVMGVVGLLAPEAIAKRLRKRYLQELERCLPDALDLMVICTEAGLSLEGSIERVAIEIAAASRVVSAELTLCGSELRILSDRRAALMNMAERTRLDAMRRVCVTLVQSQQFGTPLSAALRTLSAEMRQEQLIRFEERAARLPVLLTLPMIIFILPTLFLVVGGPAMLQVFRSW